MAKKVRQYRYYGAGSDKNQPKDITKEQLINGSIFEETNCYPILQLGIQTLPGSTFYLNGNIDPVIIGHTGIYELDLENEIEIVKLTFSKMSMEQINNITNAYLIIDVLYDDEEVI